MNAKKVKSIMRDCLSIPTSTKEDENLVADIENVKQIISNIRTIRNSKRTYHPKRNLNCRLSVKINMPHMTILQ